MSGTRRKPDGARDSARRSSDDLDGLVRAAERRGIADRDHHGRALDSIVWIVGAEGDNRLHGYRGDTGEPIFTGGGRDEAMRGLHHFQTLIVARDRLYVAGDGRVYAFEF